MKTFTQSININYRLITLLAFGMTFFISSQTFAQEIIHGVGEDKKHVHGAHKECQLPKKSSDIIECALRFHPSIRRGALKVDSTSKLEDQASQRPNPILSTRYVKGKNNGKVSSELEANLNFVVEMGGKRGARVDYALAKNSQAIANNDVTKAEVKISTILNLHRLRQVIGEKILFAQAVSAFTKVIKKLKSLPRLSAQQEASLTLFEIALEETRVNESEIFEEERELEHYFHISTGHSLDEIKELLPKSPKKWPSIHIRNTKENSPQIKKLKSLSHLAAKELEIQKSNGWSNLKIGPSIAIDKDGAVEEKRFGLNIQIPIPIFQTNGGAKAYARSELLRAQKNISLTTAEENHERFEQQRIYESAVRILNKTMKLKTIEKKHQRIQKLYLRGVIPSSVFLDSLKQKLTYLKSRNTRELTALKALWNVYKYDGILFKEKL